MTTKNDITGDELVSKTATDAYRDGYDRIFGKKTLEELASDLEDIVEAVKMLDEDDGAPT